MRPPLAQDRLTELADGRYRLELKSVWKDGTRAVIYEPMQLIDAWSLRFRHRDRT